MFVLSLVMVIFSVFCVIASVLLLIGLCVDSRMLMVPWLVLVLVTTLVDLLISMYLLIEASYSLVCVYSQYQEYCAGRGNPQVGGNRQLPEVEYHDERGGMVNAPRVANDSAATHSSTVSVVQSSSAPAVHSDSGTNSAEEGSAQYRNAEDNNLSEIKENVQDDMDAYNALTNPQCIITFSINSADGQIYDFKP
ncbi:hypothetical protein HNY73_002314 [Argiope bruennichi]|uniref:Uncharacterized protein n=1 Tax=Argiope bruennichi TaxID=94029 RepID=A0A8T0FZL7_ARGBR|nr:hypothetical protein HNY73_002314 [Argiope bruennichi]